MQYIQFISVQKLISIYEFKKNNSGLEKTKLDFSLPQLFLDISKKDFDSTTLSKTTDLTLHMIEYHVHSEINSPGSTQERSTIS